MKQVIRCVYLFLLLIVRIEGADTAFVRQLQTAVGKAEAARIIEYLDSLKAGGYPVRPFENKVREGIAKKKTGREIVQALTWKTERARLIPIESKSDRLRFEEWLLREQIRWAIDGFVPVGIVEKTFESDKAKRKPQISPKTTSRTATAGSSVSLQQRSHPPSVKTHEKLIEKIEKEERRMSRKLEKDLQRRK